MTGFNLPPGVNVSDIPGNRPEDLEEETFWEALDDKFAKEHPEYWKTIKVLLENYNEQTGHAIEAYAMMARDIAYSKGYEEGQHDANMAAMYEQEVKNDSD
jgi:hypothetical protein